MSDGTCLDGLSYEALMFLEEMTRDKEPWCGFGFATVVHTAIAEALDRKEKQMRQQRQEIFDRLRLQEASTAK